MRKKNVLFYDANSSDAHLAQIVNDLLFKFESEPVSVNTNTTDQPHFFNPNSKYDDSEISSENTYNSYIFLGVKPTKEFCSRAGSVKIIVFDDNDITPADYYENSINVVLVEYDNNITLSYRFWELIHEIYDVVKPVQNSSTHFKLLNIIKKYNEYCQTYKNENIKFEALNAYNYVNKLDLINFTATYGFYAFFESDKFPISGNEGNIENRVLNLQLAQILSDAIVKNLYDNEGNIYSAILKINADKSKIKEIDRHLRNLLISNPVYEKIDFVEYYTIDKDTNVNVRIKNASTFVSPVEIKDDVAIIEHIGAEKYERLNLYLAQEYPTLIHKNNFDCTKSFKSSMEYFF